MILNSIQFCRVAAFFDGAIILRDKGKNLDELDNLQVKALQRYTVERSTDYAMQNGVDFPDESKPGTPIPLDGRPAANMLRTGKPGRPATNPAWGYSQPRRSLGEEEVSETGRALAPGSSF